MRRILVEMLEVPIYPDKVPWRPTIAKVLLVLCYPLAIGYFIGSVYLASSIFQIIVGETIGALAFTIFDSVLLAGISILLLLPGILFERRIKSRPITNRVRRLTFVVILITWLPLIGSAFVAPFDPMLLLYLPINYTPVLSTMFFIILPLLNREFIIRQTPEKYRTRSFVGLSDSFKKQFGKRRFLPLIIWSGLMFSPLLSIGTWQSSMVSFLYNITVDFGAPVLAELVINQITYMIPSISMLPGTFLLFSLRFVFIRDLFRFSEGKVTLSRLVSLGILSEIAPAAMLTLQQFAYFMAVVVPFWHYSWILPTPFFPLLGYLFVRKSRDSLTSDLLWDDEEQQMWFDIEQPPQELRIKVPITYLIRSRLRKRRR